ncbi:AAA family ATPase [bacterium]|nr:AAA family ATPase [bacterium]
MIISRVLLRNWKNFLDVDVALGDRVFIVGPNASGKSNFLDAFLFLRDIATNGFIKAIENRGGISKIRCLSARRYPEIYIEIHLSELKEQEPFWKYAIGIRQRKGGGNEPYISTEKVWERNKLLLDRPKPEDDKDFMQKTFTHLEHASTNIKFREIYRFFTSIKYLHIIPQLIRFSDDFTYKKSTLEDSHGSKFLLYLSKTSKKTVNSRFKKIEKVLQLVVPHLKKLEYKTDNEGNPHLEMNYEHWRAKGAHQSEDQFSDGTLRLIGLLWSLLDADEMVLLEEPELSLHSGVVKKLPWMIHDVLRTKKKKIQVIISTHSYELLSDRGIGGDEVIMLRPETEKTTAIPAIDNNEIRTLLESGLTVADTVLPHTEPEKISNIYQLDLFNGR